MSDEKSTEQSTEEEPRSGTGAATEATPGTDDAEATGEAADGAGAELETLRNEVEGLRDQALRAQAEMQNVRRRAERDVEQAHRYALEKFCVELLPVLDNLERALETLDVDDDTLKPFAEGVDLTRKQFEEVLGRFGVAAINPAGEPFDPQYHEALTMVPAPDADPNTVIEVVQKGYCLHDRVIRAARVVVARSEE